MMPRGKRANGEGSLYQRKDGRWESRLIIDGKRWSYYGKTQTEAMAKRDAAKAEIIKGEYIEPSKLTLGQWLDTWFEKYTTGIRPGTLTSYDGYINGHIKPRIGDIVLSTLDTDTLQTFFNGKYRNGRLDGKGGLSEKTLKNMHDMFKRALDQAVDSDRISKNPINGVKLPKGTKPDRRVLDPQEQAHVVESSYSERHGLIIRLALDTGMREGELCGLMWTDIDFTAHTVTVKRTLQRVKSFDASTPNKTEIVIGAPKTENSKRTIPLSYKMIQELKNAKKVYSEEKLLLGAGYDDQGFIFTSPLGGMAHEPRTVQDMFKRVIKRAGIADANFHCLRHTFATRALEAEQPAKVVKDILGHGSVNVTLDTYTHVSIETMRKTIDQTSEFSQTTVRI